MRIRRFLAVALIGLFVVPFAGCQALTQALAGPSDTTAAGFATQLTDAQNQLTTTRQQLQTAEQQLAGQSVAGQKVASLESQVATLQQQAATQPANLDLAQAIKDLRDQIQKIASQPGSGVDAGAIKTIDSLQNGLQQLTTVLGKLTPVAQNYADTLKSATTPADRAAATVEAGGGLAAAIASAIPGGAPTAVGIGAVSSILAFLFRSQRNQQQAQNAATSTALQSAIDGVQNALATGAITATPLAAQIINAAIPDHPIANQLVDVLQQAARAPAAAAAAA